MSPFGTVKPTVVVEKLRADGLVQQILDSAQQIGLAHQVISAKAVFIKPNLTFPHFNPGVTTRKEFVEALVRALLDLNPRLRIYIGEGEGGYNSFSMTSALREMGFFDLEKIYPGVKILNLSTLPAKEVDIALRQGPYRLALPALFFDEIDFSISCPLPKVHGMTRLTLSFKNQWGCLPDTMRLKNHYMFNHIIAPIAELLKFRFAFLDGKFGLDNNGPMVGDPVELNWFAAANSLGAFDAVLAKMMGFDWNSVPHLRVAGERGFIPAEGQIQVIGDPASLGRQFTLKRTFWHYPALVAFQSKYLTRLFYFSNLAKPLHDIMYRFRRRPTET